MNRESNKRKEQELCLGDIYFRAQENEEPEKDQERKDLETEQQNLVSEL